MRVYYFFRNRLKKKFLRLTVKLNFMYIYMYEHMDKYDETYEQNNLTTLKPVYAKRS